MNNMAAQMAEETARENDAQALHNLLMIRTAIDQAADAVATRRIDTAKLRLGEIISRAEETIEKLTPED